MSGLLWWWSLGTEPQVPGQAVSPSLVPTSLGGVAFSPGGGGACPFSVPALALCHGLLLARLASSSSALGHSFLRPSTHLSTSQYLLNAC